MNQLRHFQSIAARCLHIGIIATFLIATASSPARADRQADFKKLEADFGVAREKFRADHTKEKPTAADFIRNYDDWQVWQYIPQFAALAEANPADDTAFQCCQWVFDQAGSFPGDGIQFAAEQKAWPIVAAHHATGDRAPKLCLQAARSASPTREQFLRDLLKQPTLSKEHAGYATFALAELLIKRMDSAEFFQKNASRLPMIRSSIIFKAVSTPPTCSTSPTPASMPAKPKAANCCAPLSTATATCLPRFRCPTWRPSATEPSKASTQLEHLTIGAERSHCRPGPRRSSAQASGFPRPRRRPLVLVHWLRPFMEMIPEERKLTEKFKDRPFSLLGVCGDEDREQAKKTATDEKITWSCWFDGSTQGTIARDYNIRGWPTFYLIDQTGHIVEKDMEHDEMVASISRLLEKHESKK